jgi:hypothetical protein
MNSQKIYALITEDNCDSLGYSSTAWHWAQRHAEDDEDFGAFESYH